ncbi:MAG: hypothetical protein A2Y74_05315 [Actinobacteria bacterium RBG_13_63_9]|nr:MAG: hypothetical protein A2Y74_05315 [Actinobacteria bacterium RBG_13_63_9]
MLILTALVGCTDPELQQIEDASDARAKICAGVAEMPATDASVRVAQKACAFGAGVATVGAALAGRYEPEPEPAPACPVVPPEPEPEPEPEPPAAPSVAPSALPTMES